MAMTQRQIEIGTKLLDYLTQVAQTNTDDYFHYLTEMCGFNQPEDTAQIGLVKDRLIRLKLVETIGDAGYWITSTLLGRQVQISGLKRFLETGKGSGGSKPTVKERNTLLLEYLYEHRYDGNYYSVMNVLDCSFAEASKLATALDQKGLINALVTKDSVDAEITVAGVEWIENAEDSDTAKRPYEPDDLFTASERKRFIEKIDELNQRLIKLEHGHELIYNDLDAQLEELKVLLNVLGKRSWVKVLKGMMVDIGLGALSDAGKDMLITTFKESRLLD